MLDRKTKWAQRVVDVHVPERGGFRQMAELTPVFFGKSYGDPDEREAIEAAFIKEGNYNMGAGSYFAADPAVIEAGKRALDDCQTRYVDFLPALNQALATKFKEENNFEVNPTLNITVVGGCEIAMSLAAMMLFDPGDEALVMDPDYMRNPCLSRLYGATVKWVPMGKSPDGGFRFDANRLAEAITPRTRALWLTNPTNPSGYLYSKEDCEAIAELVRKHDFWVITNELYDRILYDGNKHFSFPSIPGMLERTILVGGVSKNYDMTGFRIGWLVASKDMTAQIIDLMFYGGHGRPSAVGGYASLAAMTEPVRTGYPEKRRPLYARNREMICEMLNSIPGVVCPKPMSSQFVFPDFTAHTNDDPELAMYLRHEAHCTVSDGLHWGYQGQGHLRMALANPLEYEEEGIRRIEKALHKRFG